MKTKTNKKSGVATDTLEPLVRQFADFMSDKEAEYRMSGICKKDAKEKAMNDWYLYQEPNVLK